MRFKLLSGGHSVGTGGRTVNYEVGDIVETDMPLDELFKNKFERLHEQPAAPVAAPAAPAPVVAPVAEAPAEDPADAALGVEVTDTFPIATERGYRVFKNEKKYFVTGERTPGTALNEEPLKKAGVVDFIESRDE